MYAHVCGVDFSPEGASDERYYLEAFDMDDIPTLPLPGDRIWAPTQDLIELTVIRREFHFHVYGWHKGWVCYLICELVDPEGARADRDERGRKRRSKKGVVRNSQA